MPTRLATSSSYPAITVTFTVVSNAATSVTNTATVSGGNESETINGGNDSVTDATTITGVPNLTVTKSI